MRNAKIGDSHLDNISGPPSYHWQLRNSYIVLQIEKASNCVLIITLIPRSVAAQWPVVL